MRYHGLKMSVLQSARSLTGASEGNGLAIYRIKAFFMHEHEREAARDAASKSVIKDPEWTPGYVVGVIDEQDIPGLAKKGLVITPVEKIEDEPDAGALLVARPTTSSRRMRRGAPARGTRLLGTTSANPDLTSLTISVF